MDSDAVLVMIVSQVIKKSRPFTIHRLIVSTITPTACINSIKDIILYEDNHLIVINKPAGVLCQGDYTNTYNILDGIKEYRIENEKKVGAAFTALVHRLDQNVSGCMVYCKNSKAAGRLSQQFRDRKIDKNYVCIVDGILNTGTHDNKNQIVLKDTYTTHNSKNTYDAKLSIESIMIFNDCNRSLVKVKLETGRKNQIREQLSSINHSIIGDKKYNNTVYFSKDMIALHCYQLMFSHPTKHIDLSFHSYPQHETIWNSCMGGYSIKDAIDRLL